MDFIYFSFLELLYFFIAYIKIINSMAYYDLQILLIIDRGFFYGVTTIKIL